MGCWGLLSDCLTSREGGELIFTAQVKCVDVVYAIRLGSIIFIIVVASGSDSLLLQVFH